MAKHKKRPGRQKKNSTLKAFMSSKLVLIIGFILLALISVALIKELMRKHKVNEEIQVVKEEIERLERKNNELSSLVEYLGTDSFKEIQARQSLNLQKEGETAVAITEAAKPLTEKEEVNRAEEAEKEEQGKKSSIVKWWEYFFRTVAK